MTYTRGAECVKMCYEELQFSPESKNCGTEVPPQFPGSSCKVQVVVINNNRVYGVRYSVARVPLMGPKVACIYRVLVIDDVSIVKVPDMWNRGQLIWALCQAWRFIR